MKESSYLPEPKSFIAYHRVSTHMQGESGLSLEAQESITQTFAKTHGTILNTYVEIESGRRKNRPQMNLAIKECKRTKSTLLISRLDRLARNLHFITSLMESGIEFIAVDNPNANRLTVQILAAVAEEECRSISTRTKLALAAAKKRGTKLGITGKDRARENKKRANDFAASLRPMIEDIRSTGKTTTRAIAEELNARRIKTMSGKRFFPNTVNNLLKRLKIS